MSERYRVTIECFNDSGEVNASSMFMQDDLEAAIRFAVVAVTDDVADVVIARLVCEHNSWKGDGEVEFQNLSSAAEEFLKAKATP